MISHTGSSPPQDALSLVEEALSLLGRMPLVSLVTAFVGSLPFTFVFLLYLLDLVHNPRAPEELAGYSAALALLYVWLRIWQSVFAAEVWQTRSGNPAFGWTWREWLTIARRNALLAPFSIALLLSSAVLVFPFAWVYSLHHNLGLLVMPAFDNVDASTRAGTLRAAWRQARLWPGSNQLVILLIMLVGLVVCVNFVSLFFLIPYLVRFLTGWDTTFTRLGTRLVDLKVLLAAGTLTYLALSPLVRTVYVLRCFYGLSARTGDDLASALRQTRKARAAGVTVWVLLLLPVGTTLVHSANGAVLAVPSAPPAGPSVTELDRSIDAVLKNPKHVWHAPQNVRSDRQSSFLRDFARAVGRALDTVIDWIMAIRRWLWPDEQVNASPGIRKSWIDIKTAATALLIVTLGVLLLVLVRTILASRRSGKPEATTPLVPSPDLGDADVSPTELPEEGWLRLAAEMADRGEMRLAIRAVYLAALACLADRRLITATRFKSNRDYLRELQRKTRGAPVIVDSFQPMIAVFERVWYGTHRSTVAELEEMRRLLEGLRISGMPGGIPGT